MSDLNVVSYGTTWKGLRNTLSPELPILDAKEKKFNSLIPSRGNTPTLPLVATYSNYSEYGDGFERGAIYFDEEGKYHEVSLDGEKYDYIDGFDHGLARVYKIDGGQKKWGIIGLVKTEKGYRAKICIELRYDNIWNFYGKERKSTPAFVGGLAEHIPLEKLQKELLYDQPLPANVESSTTEDKQVKIKKIEVTNFKRYAKPTSIDLSSRITFFVGKNNAGKSTFLDAIELCTTNMTQYLLYSEDGSPYFCFENNESIEVQNDLFFKKLNNDAESPYMSFVLTAGDWEFEFLIYGGAFIEKISITNSTNSEKVVFTKGRVEMQFQNMKTEDYFFKEKWISFIPEVEGNSAEEKYANLIKRCKEFIEPKPQDDELYKAFIRDIELYKGATGLERLLTPLTAFIKSDKTPSKDNELAKEMLLSIDNAIKTGQGTVRLHVFTSIGKKRYRKTQKENEEQPMEVDFVSDSIIKFYGIDDRYHQFVCKWLRYMEMGVDFSFEDETEDYFAMIVKQENNVESNLCDMGSGTIHFVALCFKLLSLVEKYKDNPFAPIILIEEPEQNLHPMLQSHMANFLLDISDLYTELSNGKELKMIVETHSEYLIKRSQVTARRFAKCGQEIPYRTYYFPTNRSPYDMVYTNSGRFKEEFEHGFTDESSILSFQLL